MYLVFSAGPFDFTQRNMPQIDMEISKFPNIFGVFPNIFGDKSFPNRFKKLPNQFGLFPKPVWSFLFKKNIFKNFQVNLGKQKY